MPAPYNVKRDKCFSYDHIRSYLIHSEIQLYARIYFICYCITLASDYLEQTNKPHIISNKQ